MTLAASAADLAGCTSGEFILDALLGGAEALMWDLARMDLGDWHPREIPESLLKGTALQQQQAHTLPPMEQWYFMLLHDAKLPGAGKKNPRLAMTKPLIEDAKNRVARLKWELGDTELKSFLTNKERIGLAHEHKHTRTGNGWLIEPLADCRKAWEKLYGPQRWETDAQEWEPVAELLDRSAMLRGLGKGDEAWCEGCEGP